MRLIIDVSGNELKAMKVETEDGGQVSIRQVLSALEAAENGILDGLSIGSTEIEAGPNAGVERAEGAL
ncbi:MAG: hypothetical protein GY753_12790 [Gammaproteobacteria bacterium]|nr:hypothetical protein [Gammaproteobacteria bacterium]